MAMCEKLGLTGQDAVQFIKEQQDQKCEDLARAREEKRLKL